VRVVEAESAVESFQKKVELRQLFLKGGIRAAEAELRLLEIEGEQRLKALRPMAELAAKEAERVKGRYELGAAQIAEVSAANLRWEEARLEVMRVEQQVLLIKGQARLTSTGK